MASTDILVWAPDRTEREEYFLEELVERSREHALLTLQSLTFIAPSPAHPVRDWKYDDWIKAPEDECEHGHLQTDRTIHCDCYSEVADG